MRKLRVMDPYWLQFWQQVRVRTKYLLWGLPFSLVPYFINLSYLWESGRLLSGLLYSFGFGLLVGGTVWSTFVAAYLALAWIRLHYGYYPRSTRWFDISVGICGTVLGILVLQYVRKLIWNIPLFGGGFMVSLTIGFIGLTLFLLYSMYQEARAEALRQQAALSEARYHLLENQMRPHFLFNALNSLAELIESKQENAADVALTLSDLYRKILANSKTKTASLQSELEITRAYLELEQLRFGARLTFAIETPQNTANIFLPSLSLQTLVENAVKHGIAKSVEGGRIEISVRQHAPQLYQLRVCNSGLPYNSNGAASGTGLANTQERLQMLYGNRHQFQIGADDAGRTCVSFYFTGENIA